jgi:hypothetical protein
MQNTKHYRKSVQRYKSNINERNVKNVRQDEEPEDNVQNKVLNERTHVRGAFMNRIE